MKNLLVIAQKVDENDNHRGFFIDWLKEFGENFNEVLVITVAEGSYSLPRNIHIYSLGKERGYSKFIQAVRFYWYLLQLLPKSNGIFAHASPIFVIASWPLAFMYRKKVTMWYAHKSVTFKLKLAEKFSDIIFTSTPDGFRLNSKKVKVVGQGININLFKPDELVRPAPETLISVGRIAPIKNYEPLIEAIKIIKDDGISLNVTIVGEPTLSIDFKYQDKLKKMLKDMGIEERIRFVGKITNNDLPNYYRKNKIYINLSNTGSLDKTILEAMASGCVVLSSNDSAKKFLPSKLIIRSENPNDLAEQIKEAMRLDIGDELRDYVVRNHSLPELIKSMSESIKLP